MTRIPVPKDCIGLEMADGAKYDSGGREFVEVSDSNHLTAIAKSRHTEIGWIGRPQTTFSGVQGWDCPRCHFSAFAWQDHCPRCIRKGQ